MLKNGKKKWSAWLLMICLSIGVGAGCSQTVQRVAPPPLPDRPALHSLQRLAHPRTAELGYWLNDPDLRALTVYSEGVEAVREKWK